MENLSIQVKGLCISYKKLEKVRIKSNLFNFKRLKKEDKEVLDNVSFDVKKGEIIGIIGKNGCGKSTLLRSIAGIISIDKGQIDLKNNKVSLLALGIGFNEQLTGYDNIFLSGMLLGLNKNNIKDKLKEIIDFSELGEDIYKPVKTYSSGMKLKLAFSINVILETDIILIDEVLSVGDIAFKKKSYNKIKEIITDKDKTTLIVSHDLNILEELCNRVIWLQDKKIRMMGNTNEVIREYKNCYSI